MKNVMYKSLLATLVMVALWSCESDFINTEQSIEPPNPIRTTIADYQGIVSDESGIAIEGATIEMGDEIAMSDPNGVFQITGKTNAEKTYIKVNKEGYFDAYGVVGTPRGTKGFVNFVLQEKTLVYTGSSQSEIDITFESNKGGVTIAPNSYITEDGKEYQGEVNIYARYIDPSAENFSEVMPGALFGINTINEEVGLQSFGMVNIELFGENNESLNLSRAADLYIEVPESLKGSAPPEIPLWYFDDQLGRWVEDGNATFSDGSFSGQVNHFTPWNVDIVTDLVKINGRLSSSGPNSDAFVNFTGLVVEAIDSRGVRINEDGSFVIYLIENTSYTAEVAFFCVEPTEETVGPYFEESDLVIIDAEIDYRIIVGEVLECDDIGRIPSGYAILSCVDPSTSVVLQSSILTLDNGMYRGFVPANPEFELEIRAFNSANQYLSSSIPIVLNPSGDPTQIQNLIPCNELKNIVSFDYNGEKLEFECIVTEEMPGSKDKWIFTFTDNYNGGIVTYKYIVIEWAQDDIFLSWGYDLITDVGENGRIFNFGVYPEGPNICTEKFDIRSYRKGEPIKIRIENCGVSDEVGGHFNSSDFLLQGIIQ